MEGDAAQETDPIHSTSLDGDLSRQLVADQHTRHPTPRPPGSRALRLAPQYLQQPSREMTQTKTLQTMHLLGLLLAPAQRLHWLGSLSPGVQPTGST